MEDKELAKLYWIDKLSIRDIATLKQQPVYIIARTFYAWGLIDHINDYFELPYCFMDYSYSTAMNKHGFKKSHQSIEEGKLLKKEVEYEHKIEQILSVYINPLKDEINQLKSELQLIKKVFNIKNDI